MKARSNGVWRGGLLALLAVVVVGAAVCALIAPNRRNIVEARLISAIDAGRDGRGECDLDLAEVFKAFDWDTAYLYIAGNQKQVRDELGIDTEVSNGIVFQKDGTLVMEHSSFYQFPADTPPDVDYSIDQLGPSDPHYVALPRDDAVVHGRRYWWNGSWKYAVSR